MPMEQRSSIEEYLASPIGSYFCGPTYLLWHRHPCLSGIVFWGRLEPRHIECVIRVIDGKVKNVKCASLVDARRIESIDLSAFEVMAKFFQAYNTRLTTKLCTQAIVRSESLIGLTIVGFYKVLEQGHPVEIFTDPSEALTWLGYTDSHSIRQEIDGLVEAKHSCHKIVPAVRSTIAKNLKFATIEEVANSLGLSIRNLQRKLQLAHSSFRTEQTRVRIEAAKCLMVETNWAIKRIAIEVGCSSSTVFDSMFRRTEGLSPLAWKYREELKMSPSLPNPSGNKTSSA